MALSQDPAWFTCTVSLADRFGDNGLISVVLAQAVDGALDIDTWLMSCRVLKREVEKLVLNHLAQAALARGLRRLCGTYIATVKNDLVREHYRNLGFAEVTSSVPGGTRWELSLDGWSDRSLPIEEVGSNGQVR